MNARNPWHFVAVAAAALMISTLGGVPTSGSSASEAGNAVTDWSLIAQTAIAEGRPPGSSQVLHGIVHAAMYDAVVAVEGGFQPFAIAPPVARPASADAAVAAAAHAVLVARVPDQAGHIDERYAASLDAHEDGPSEDNGIAVGEAVAAGILGLRANDGFGADVPYDQPAPGPGVFEPTPPPDNPVDVALARVRPLTFFAPSRFRPSGPPALTSPRYTEDFLEVATLGRADGTVRTPEQTETAEFWSENTYVQWNRNLRNLAVTRQLDLVDTARMMAMAHVAAADAVIGCFDAKYHFLSWRPVHAITRAEADGNPATETDTGWSPLLIVNHPEYPSAHACWSQAVTDAVAAFFGTDRVGLSLDSTATGTTREYPTVRAVMRDVVVARIAGGLHFRYAMTDGALLGYRVARHVTENYFLRHASTGRASPR
jgi:hypothetical protein